jgi:PAS domain S-box-containing protein
VKTVGAVSSALPDFADPLPAPAGLPPVEALFRNAVEQAPVGIAFANRDGSYRHCNESFCQLLGFSAEELKHQSIAGLTLADDVAATNAELARLWRGEIIHVDIEKRYVRKDGSALWVRVTTSLVREDDAAAVCSVEFLRDISVRKEMAAALLQNQTLLAAVIAELPLALLACDVTGRVTHYNRRAVDLFGISTDGTLGIASPVSSKIYRLDGTTPLPVEERPLSRALRGDEVSDAEFVVVTPEGAVRTVISSARRLIGPAGQALGAVAVVQDITERRLAEQELEHLHKQLMLTSRYAGMAEVATNVLHNVGNVLNSVNVSASLLSERVKKSKCAKLGQVAALLAAHAGDLPRFLAGPQGKHLPSFLQELATDLAGERDTAVAELVALRGNVEHIKEIVAMQQSYARRGGLSEVLDIRSLVEDSLRMNEGAFTRHGVTIVRDYQDAPSIQVDKHKVLQILVNIIRNAKYACQDTAEKRVTVRIRTTATAVLVSVIDTGIGIPKENIERIFGHGFTTRPDGHGFGLHSSAIAADELGGTLHAESAGLGLGAVFTLSLPITAPEPSDGQ